LYLLAKDKLEVLLQEGGYGPNDKLPPERELAGLLGISRGTLREALRVAQQERLIVQRHGSGTYVADPRTFTENGMAALESLNSLARRRGWEAVSLEVVIEQRPMEARVADALGRETGSPATYVSWVTEMNGERVAYIVDVVPAEIISVEEMRQSFKGSVLDLISARGEPTIDHARTYILATCADEEVAAKLDVPVGHSLLLTEEILYSTDQEPFEFSYNYFAADFFRFFITRSMG
jgi:GntR family transcriptional regulator